MATARTEIKTASAFFNFAPSLDEVCTARKSEKTPNAKMFTQTTLAPVGASKRTETRSPEKKHSTDTAALVRMTER